ncbi:MAG TPA: hypothetical protein VLG13_03350 [Patescibacteria group bacterium]|nr:hypothetical protein [Patescibacteria group bacterium]
MAIRKQRKIFVLSAVVVVVVTLLIGFFYPSDSNKGIKSIEFPFGWSNNCNQSFNGPACGVCAAAAVLNVNVAPDETTGWPLANTRISPVLCDEGEHNTLAEIVNWGIYTIFAGSILYVVYRQGFKKGMSKDDKATEA